MFPFRWRSCVAARMSVVVLKEDFCCSAVFTLKRKSKSLRPLTQFRNLFL